MDNEKHIANLKDEKYQVLFGVRKPTFDAMREKGGRKRKISALDMLIIILGYQRFIWQSYLRIRGKRLCYVHDFEIFKLPIDGEVDFDDLVAKTEKFNGSDIAEFCNRCTDARIERQVKIKDAGGKIEIPNNEIFLDEYKISKEAFDNIIDELVGYGYL